MTTPDDLIERLEKAAVDLDRLADLRRTDALLAEDERDVDRLKGKAQGVRLALSYVRDMLRCTP